MPIVPTGVLTLQRCRQVCNDVAPAVKVNVLALATGFEEFARPFRIDT